MADQPTPDTAAQKPGRRVDLTRVVRRLTEQVAELTEHNTVLQVVVEEQDELIAQLRAELVKATSGGAEEPAAAA